MSVNLHGELGVTCQTLLLTRCYMSVNLHGELGVTCLLTSMVN